MTLQRAMIQVAALVFVAGFLTACDSQNRKHSTNYHINSMERTDAQPYCVNKCGHTKPSDWNKDK